MTLGMDFPIPKGKEKGERRMKKRWHWCFWFLCLWLTASVYTEINASEKVPVTIPGKRFYMIAEDVVEQINQKRIANGLGILQMDGELMEMAMHGAAQYQMGDGYVPEGDVSCPYRAVRLTSYMEWNLYQEAVHVMEEETTRIVAGCESLTDGWENYGRIGIGCFAAKPGEFLNNNVGVVVLLGEGGMQQEYHSPGKNLFCREEGMAEKGAFWLTVSGKINQTADGAYDVMKKGESRDLAPALESRRSFKMVNMEKVPYRTTLSGEGAFWRSSDPSVASVTADGRVQAKKCGVCILFVEFGPWAASRKIVVADRIGSNQMGYVYPIYDRPGSIPSGYSGKCSVGGKICFVTNGKGMPKEVSKKKTDGTSIGKRIKNKGAYYRVVSAKKRTVQFQKPVRTNLSVMEIPETVSFKGKKYRVISISADAFRGCRALKKVTIGNNIRTIGKRAFYGCRKLKHIGIKTKHLTGTSVGKQAFSRVHPNVKVKVPSGKVSRYRKLLSAKGIGKKVKIKRQ